MSQERRMQFYARAGEETPYIAAEANGAVYLVRTQDLNVGRSLFVKGGRSEMLVLGRVAALLRAIAGDEVTDARMFIDIGANIGTTTIPALLDHGFGTALALEPEPHNLLMLRVNALLNGLEERVETMGVAVSNRSGTSSLVVDLGQGGKHWIAANSDMLKRAQRTDATVVTVEAVTLDDLVDRGTVDLDRVGLVWIDAQAHEGHILEGAAQVVQRGVPIVVEWAPRALDRLGDRGKLERAAAAHYSHFVDLRPDYESEPRFRLRATEELHDHTDRTSVTDLLLLRLTNPQAAELDVEKIINAIGRRKTPDDALLRRLASELAGPDPKRPRRAKANAASDAKKRNRSRKLRSDD